MSRLLDKLSEESGYTYNTLVDIWNIAECYDRKDWIKKFEVITLNRGWWDMFGFEHGDPVYIKDGDEIYDGVIDDLDNIDHHIRILYEDDRSGEKIRWVTFDEYVETLAICLMED